MKTFSRIFVGLVVVTAISYVGWLIGLLIEKFILHVWMPWWVVSWFGMVSALFVGFLLLVILKGLHSIGKAILG